MRQLGRDERRNLRKAQAISLWHDRRRAEKKAAPRKLNRDRRGHLVDTVAAIMRNTEPTPFAAEAPCLHFIRSRLCLKGWAWGEADTLAAEIVASALKRIGARRPTWKQGQPEWTQEGFAPIARTRCVQCRRPLPEDRPRFCDDHCRTVFHSWLGTLRRVEEHRVYDLVARGAKWLEKPSV